MAGRRIDCGLPALRHALVAGTRQRIRMKFLLAPAAALLAAAATTPAAADMYDLLLRKNTRDSPSHESLPSISVPSMVPRSSHAAGPLASRHDSLTHRRFWVFPAHYIPPVECSRGCAAWASVPGNSALWAAGAPPPSASNLCAIAAAAVDTAVGETLKSADTLSPFPVESTTEGDAVHRTDWFADD